MWMPREATAQKWCWCRESQEAFREIEEYEKDGWISVHPFDDPLVMAGQGTVGWRLWKICRMSPTWSSSIGGGGFIAGVATAIKSLRPAARIWGVETEGADAMSKALAAGHPVQLEAITSIARTLGAPSVSARTLGLAQKYLESVTLVPDAEAMSALAYCWSAPRC